LRYGWLLSEIGPNRVMGETRRDLEQGLPRSAAQLAEAIAQKDPANGSKAAGTLRTPHPEGEKSRREACIFVEGPRGREKSA
jgi:hypothetical protein